MVREKNGGMDGILDVPFVTRYLKGAEKIKKIIFLKNWFIV